MRFLRPVLAAALTVGGVALATQAIADTPVRADMKLELRDVKVVMSDFSFPSGLRVIFQEDHTQPVVALTMMIDHGSQDDPEGREGIAHLIEHLWFRSVHTGTDGKDLPKIMDFIKQMGAAFNATTAPDRTNYLTVVRAPLLETAMKLEALRLRDAVRKVTNENVLVEREVVRNELRLSYENGGAAALGYLYDKLWPAGHPYHHLTIGTHDSLNAVTLKDIQDYVTKYYVPSETTLVVAGDLNLADASKYLQVFGVDQLAAPDDPEGKNITLVPPKIRISGPPKEPPEMPATPIEVKGEITGLQTYHAAVDKPTVVIGWTLPSAYGPQDPLIDAAVFQLSIAISQELFPAWEYEAGEEPPGSAGCFSDRGRYGSSAICFVEFKKAVDAPKMVEKALNGVYKVYDRGDEIAQFQKILFQQSQQSGMAQTLHLVDEVTDLFAGRSALISDFVHFTGDPLYYTRQIQWGNAVKIDAIRDFAGKYLRRERAVAVAIEPYEEGDLTLDSSDSAYRGQSRDQSILTLFNPDEVTPAAIRETIVVPDTTKIVQETLPNGVKLFVMPHTQGPLVQVGVSFAGGAGSVDMDRLVARGTQDNVSFAHPTVIQSLRIAGGDDFSFGDLGGNITVAASAANVADAVYVARYRLDDILPDTNGRLVWVKEGKDDTLAWMSPKKAADAAANIQSSRLFPGHPFGDYLTHKDWDVLNTMGNAQVSATLARVLRPKNTALFIVGNITVEEARSAATTYFAGWTGWGKEPAGWTAPRAEYAPPPPPPERAVLLFNKDLATQTTINYQCQLAPITDENEWAANVMSDVVSDGLWLALREQTGASYGAYPYLRYQTGGVGVFGQAVSAQNDQVGYAVKVFLENGERTKAGKLDDRIVATQKFNNAQAYVLGQVSTSAMLMRLMGRYTRGQGMDYFDKIADRIGNVSQKDFPPLLERCVGHEIVTAVGPLAIIKPQFDKLGIPVEVVDLDAYRKDYRVRMGLKPEKEKKAEKKK
ncbi:MAG: insulinase family protein [Myxococcales bacterium]|nr:insulinase family protein [Myxococcales bacterium]